MSTHNTTFPDVQRPLFDGFRDPAERLSTKSRNLAYYLYLVEPYFDRLEVYSTEGDYRVPYPFQWVAYSKVFLGDDDGFEGTGGTPLEAVRNLYHEMKDATVEALSELPEEKS